MKYQVLGDKVLIQVKKYTVKKDATFQGTSILMPEAITDAETTVQTSGEVIQIGPLAFKFDDGSPNGAMGSVELHDIVHFTRYGAIRLGVKDSEDHELWIVNDKDIIAKEVHHNVD